MLEGHISSGDLMVVVSAAVCLYSLRKLLSRYVFKPYGMQQGLKKESTELTRFVENAWFTTYYTFFATFGLYISYQAQWTRDLSRIHDNWPEDHHLDFDRHPYLRFFYLVSLGFYGQAIFTLIFIDERMKDFTEMVLHHVFTIMLVFLSILTLGHRGGQVILTLHDVVDVFLYSAKALHALDKQLLTNIMFGLFSLTYLLLRLILLPYMTYICYTCPLTVGKPYGSISQYVYWLNFSFLPPLLCLHVYWFSLVIKLLIKTFGLGGVPGDPRHKTKAA